MVLSLAALSSALSLRCGPPAVFDPARVTDVLRVATVAEGVAARTWDGTVFVSSGTNLHVIDASDAANPRMRAMVPNVFPMPRKLAVEDRTLYACGPGGFAAYNIEQPANPILLRAFDSTNVCRDVVAFRGTMLMALGEFGFGVMDWSNPATVVNPIGYLGGGDAVAIVRVGQFAYGADARRGLAVLDFGTGNTVVASRNLPEVLANPTAIGALDARTVFAADARQFVVLDVSNGAMPRVMGRGMMGVMGQPLTGVGHIQIRAASRQAFIAQGGTNAVLSVDVSDPLTPRANGALRVLGEVGQMALVDDTTLALAFAPGGAVFRRAQ